MDQLEVLIIQPNEPISEQVYRAVMTDENCEDVLKGADPNNGKKQVYAVVDGKFCIWEHDGWKPCEESQFAQAEDAHDSQG